MIVARERGTTAELLAYLAEIDLRKLYSPAGYPSMLAYCIGRLRMSDGAAYRRIQAARAARKFPELFSAVAEGRLHLTAVCLLSPHLTQKNVEELITAATHRRKLEIQEMLARRFPRPDVPTLIRSLPARSPVQLRQPAPAQVQVAEMETSPELAGQGAISALESTDQPTLAEVAVPAPEPTARPQPVPLSAGRYLLRITIDQEMHDLLRQAQALLRHSIPSGDEAQVLKRSLRLLVASLQKRKFAATTEPRQPRSNQEARSQRSSTVGERYIPAHVRRAVRERDQGQCTFISASGHRCGAREFLEFDHIDPVARGGRATVQTIRLRCRAHNQYEAERMLGAEFMNAKRQEAKRIAGERQGAGIPGETSAA